VETEPDTEPEARGGEIESAALILYSDSPLIWEKPQDPGSTEQVLFPLPQPLLTRGLLCSTSFQPSAAETCSPTATRVHMTLPYARTAWWYWRQVMWPHLAASTECGGHLSARAQWPAEPWQGSIHNCFPLRKLFASSCGQQGGRRSTTTPSSWRAQGPQASPTRPGQPSLASVGSGRAAGAAFAHPPVREPRGRPIFFSQMSRER